MENEHNSTNSSSLSSDGSNDEESKTKEVETKTDVVIDGIREQRNGSNEGLAVIRCDVDPIDSRPQASETRHATPPKTDTPASPIRITRTESLVCIDKTASLVASTAGPSFSQTDSHPRGIPKMVAQAAQKKGRRGDPRMHGAVAARIANPKLSLLEALGAGGFKFPESSDVISSTYNIQDSESVQLGQRKNQLSRRLRLMRQQALKNDNAPPCSNNANAYSAGGTTDTTSDLFSIRTLETVSIPRNVTLNEGIVSAHSFQNCNEPSSATLHAPSPADVLKTQAKKKRRIRHLSELIPGQLEEVQVSAADMSIPTTIGGFPSNAPLNNIQGRSAVLNQASLTSSFINNAAVEPNSSTAAAAATYGNILYHDPTHSVAPPQKNDDVIAKVNADSVARKHQQATSGFMCGLWETGQLLLNSGGAAAGSGDPKGIGGSLMNGAVAGMANAGVDQSQQGNGPVGGTIPQRETIRPVPARPPHNGTAHVNPNTSPLTGLPVASIIEPHKMALALNFFRAEFSSLLKRCMLVAGYESTQTDECDENYLRYVDQVLNSERRRLDRLHDTFMQINGKEIYPAAPEPSDCHAVPAASQRNAESKTSPHSRHLHRLQGKCGHKAILHRPNGIHTAHVDFVVGNKIECFQGLKPIFVETECGSALWPSQFKCKQLDCLPCEKESPPDSTDESIHEHEELKCDQVMEHLDPKAISNVNPKVFNLDEIDLKTDEWNLDIFNHSDDEEDEFLINLMKLQE